jgi:hypothetical protein
MRPLSRPLATRTGPSSRRSTRATSARPAHPPPRMPRCRGRQSARRLVRERGRREARARARQPRASSASTASTCWRRSCRGARRRSRTSSHPCRPPTRSAQVCRRWSGPARVCRQPDAGRPRRCVRLRWVRRGEGRTAHAPLAAVLRQRALDHATRERYGDGGLCMLRLLLAAGKTDERASTRACTWRRRASTRRSPPPRVWEREGRCVRTRAIY